MNVNAQKQVGEEKEKRPFWWQPPDAPSCHTPALKPDDICPSCAIGTLDYDGLFLLTCSVCKKVSEGGAFT